jgi:hypothetical protein
MLSTHCNRAHHPLSIPVSSGRKCHAACPRTPAARPGAAPAIAYPSAARGIAGLADALRSGNSRPCNTCGAPHRSRAHHCKTCMPARGGCGAPLQHLRLRARRDFAAMQHFPSVSRRDFAGLRSLQHADLQSDERFPSDFRPSGRSRIYHHPPGRKTAGFPTNTTESYGH